MQGEPSELQINCGGATAAFLYDLRYSSWENCVESGYPVVLWILSLCACPIMSAQAIKTVGVCGTGVIGASWTGLFLARGLRVLVSDPAPQAAEKLATHIDGIWPTLQEIGLASNASKENYKFVGQNLRARYGELDFVQEVNSPVPVVADGADDVVLLLERTREARPQNQAGRRDRRWHSAGRSHSLIVVGNHQLELHRRLQAPRAHSHRASIQPASPDAARRSGPKSEDKRRAHESCDQLLQESRQAPSPGQKGSAWLCGKSTTSCFAQRSV
jgi:hypothetical protein